MSEPKTDMGADAQHQAGRSPRRWWIWIALLGVALALSLAAWLLWQGETRRAPGTVITQAPPAGMRPPASPAADAQAGTTGAAPPPAGAPSATANPGATQPGTAGRPRHPIENALGGEGPVDPAVDKLERAAAEKAVSQALGTLPNKETLLRFVIPAEFVRRFVLTVDNLPGETMSMQYRAIVATPGPFVTETRDGNLLIGAQNPRRYEPFVKMAVSLDTRRVVGLYKRFYPLFQQEFRSIGYPDGYFNDRLIQAIDDLLAAPVTSGSQALAQPRVLYEYADTALEERSVGQKMLIRMGPEHAAQLKAKLREVRKALTHE